jgi:rhomboid protease GluP
MTIPPLELNVFGLFEQVVLGAVSHAGAKLDIAELDRNRCTLRLPHGLGGEVAVVCLRFRPEVAAAELKQVAALAKALPVDIVLVGGGAEAWPLLRKARPFYTPMRIGLLHIDDQRQVRQDRTTVAAKLLTPLEEKVEPRVVPERWSQLLERSASTRAQAVQRGAELEGFTALFKQRKPIATWSIAAVIGIVFGVEVLLGGAQQEPPTLMRMGALLPARVVAGEWWRVLSCTFLHSGLVHVLLNVYVLLILGGFLERIIGPARFLLLYLASALAGSAGSALFLKTGFSVGASGAVWGLLGAHAVLAYRSTGLLPQAIVPGARRAAVINLVINVLNSFRPHVDLWAHFAGGAAGAVFFVSGALTRGLPRLDEAHPAAPTASLAKIPTPGAVWVGGALAAALLLGAPAIGFLQGHALDLRRPPELSRRELAGQGLSVELPSRAPERVVELPPHGRELMFGDVVADPLSVVVWSAPIPKLDAEQMAAELATFKKSLEVPQNAKPTSPPADFQRGGDPGITVTYSYPSGLMLERAFLFLPGKLVRVEILRWSQYPVAAPPGMARRLVETVRTP